MATTLRVPEPPQPLINALLNGECVLYAGAGLSAQAKLPVWSEFVGQLAEWATTQGRLDAALVESVQEALQTDLGLVADTIVSRSSIAPDAQLTFGTSSPITIDGELHDFLKKVFERIVKPAAVHKKLGDLPFSAALTTNFDKLLERVYPGRPVHTHRDADGLLQRLARREFFILKLYGNLDKPDTVIVSPSQYETEVASNRLLAKFMETLFVSRTLLFLGASLEGISDYLNGIRFSGQSSREHYALVAVAGTAWKVKADMLQRRYGITVLPFSLSEKWREVEQFTNRLLSTVQRAQRGSVPEAAEDLSLIKRLEIMDIGPFEHLELEFGDHWNVLLGDNGVGKSSILRSIATVLCGDEARPYAGRLIRSGRPKATIALETSKNTYVVELFRTDTDAEMRVHSGSPLQAEGWLALAFPPLRSLTWNRDTDTASSSDIARPTAADLMPLMKGELDPRLDSLKEWLLSIDHQIATRQDSALSRLRDKLFEIVAALTPGLRLEYDSVNAATGEVFVRTDDGKVPIEVISQGTSSLIGWIGVTLQRMFTVYPTDTDPWMRPCVILIDEVDAHMHPAWQQNLPSELRNQFPRAQIIATTHSPLIVASLQTQDVHYMKRVAGVVSVERPQIDFTGYRADQILTSPAFGLYSTIAPEVQRELEEYVDLLTRGTRTRTAERRLKELAVKLGEQIPAPEEQEAARRAYNNIREWMKDRDQGVPDDEKKRALHEIEKRLHRIVRSSSR